MHSSAPATPNALDTYIGVMTGTIQPADDGLQLLCFSDQTVFAIAITGPDLVLPLPTGLQRWQVFPRTNSDGSITGFKTWQFEAVDAAPEVETWQFTGRIRQVSPRQGILVLGVKVQVPQPQEIALTLRTPAVAHFIVGQRWTVAVNRNGSYFDLRSARCLSPTPRLLSSAELAGAPLATNAIASTSSDPACLVPEALFQKVRDALHLVTRQTDWTIHPPASREDHHWHVPVWEFEAVSPHQTARVKVSQRDDRYIVYPFPTPKSKAIQVPNPEERLSVTPLGAAQSIGASCFRVQIGPYEIVLDTGTRPKGQNPLPAFEKLTQPDLLLITHAHQDHLGALPVFHRLFAGTPMICTPGTRELAHVMLRDGLSVQQRNEDTDPLFNELELEQALFRLQTQPIGQDFEPLPGLTVRFIYAGHIVGAACIYLRYGERSLVYTGDFHIASSRTTEGLRLSDLPQADMLITESTYGNTHHPSRKQQERELIDAVSQVVKQGGNVLIPAFALGRAQELILAFRQHAEFQKLGIPIYIDGLVRAVTDCLRSHLSLLPETVQRFAQTQEPFFSPAAPEIIPISRREDRPLAMARPSVIIASSGMLSGGASVYYAQTLLERENAALFISGYTDEESPGRRVQALTTGSVLNLAGQDITVRAQVKRFSLSAHADKTGICQVIERVSPRSLILIHGSRDALHELARTSDLQQKYLIHIPSVGEEIAYDSVPAHLPPQHLAQMQQPQTFEITLEAEIEGGWLRIPEEIVEHDARWKRLTRTGYLKAKWEGNRLLLSCIVKPSAGAIEIAEDQVCCGNCTFFQTACCDCPDSPLFERQVDPMGKCLAFLSHLDDRLDDDSNNSFGDLVDDIKSD